tara:strand:+ start:47 stop:652 length:606 start_codon:yes stop_codon:yes gene_type:complete
MTKNKEILIIANGNSIVNYNHSHYINNFSTVARINNFQIKNFEKNIGNKTDIWFHGANQGVKARKNPPKNIIVFVPSKILIKKQEHIFKIIKNRQNLNPDDYKLIDLKTIKKYENLLSLERLTTGTKSILWAMENYQKIIIHGFDFFTISKNHYFDSKIKKWFYNNFYTLSKKHNVKDEMNYINKQIKKGKIFLLNDIIEQ